MNPELISTPEAICKHKLCILTQLPFTNISGIQNIIFLYYHDPPLHVCDQDTLLSKRCHAAYRDAERAIPWTVQYIQEDIKQHIQAIDRDTATKDVRHLSNKDELPFIFRYVTSWVPDHVVGCMTYVNAINNKVNHRLVYVHDQEHIVAFSFFPDGSNPSWSLHDLFRTALKMDVIDDRWIELDSAMAKASR